MPGDMKIRHSLEYFLGKSTNFNPVKVYSQPCLRGRDDYQPKQLATAHQVAWLRHAVSLSSGGFSFSAFITRLLARVQDAISKGEFE